MDLKLGMYRHFKGKMCEVIAIALDSETQEKMVVYKESSDGKLWVRPLKMFVEHVERDGYSGPRFVCVKEN